MNSYKTINTPVQSDVLKIKKSKFIGVAYPVTNEKEVKDALSSIKTQHPSASHWCYAYKIGVENELIKANDDGEPNNSAGKPILGQITAFGVTNLLVVIVRYYGGTKLGVGGLISAYKDASKLVLSKAHIIEKELTDSIELQFKYDLLNAVMRIIKLHQLEIMYQDMTLNCCLRLKIPRRIFEEVKDKYAAIYGLKVKVL